MAIDLRDIPDAVQNYLNTKVAISIGPILDVGLQVGPSENFSFVITVTNANTLNGGVELMGVQYRVELGNGLAAQIKAPASGGTSTDLSGDALAAGASTHGFIFTPSGALARLGVGNTDSLTVTGKAAGTEAGGSTSISVRVIANVDTAKLFPRADTPNATKTLRIIG